jgi:hypothetical protein
LSERGQRRASFLPPFADTSYVGAGAEVHGVPFEAGQLGQAQARLVSDARIVARRRRAVMGAQFFVAPRLGRPLDTFDKEPKRRIRGATPGTPPLWLALACCVKSNQTATTRRRPLLCGRPRKGAGALLVDMADLYRIPDERR